jgi:excisionase family DNA binding protein
VGGDRRAKEIDRLLDVKEAAAILALKPATLYQWAYERRLPVVKLSGPRGPLRFRLSDIEKLIARSLRPALKRTGEEADLRGRRRDV